ncbi:MAG: phosphoenolpyruvate--protein phosphotransferase [Stigonema ocellatum SAG 48.90 = DSM 106950]|nr:phosphoenolpyruvate--protein phosphotransferase [Stigonema ocellatum SAG 48.90 = DSM 106950]
MVGIVIVSHSKQLALGVLELAAQMVQGQVPIVVASGIDDPENPLGTDPIQVHQAIASLIYDHDVLVLMDLGSAVMSAEMALEFLPEEQRNKVHLCEAPLVEGAIAAVVAAASGKNIEQVMTEARGALVAKATQLGIAPTQPLAASSNNQPTTYKEQKTQEIRLIVRNRLGLHARPAAQFVATAARFQCQIKVQNLTRGTELVRADSINQIATLGVRQGHELMVTATGADADEALAALLALVATNFGESDVFPSVQPSSPSLLNEDTTPLFLQGIPASGGVAIAPVFLHRTISLSVQDKHANNLEKETQKIQLAIQSAKQEIQALRTRVATQVGEEQAAIFDAHQLILDDQTLAEAIHERIFTHSQNAEAAWQAVMDELVATYRQMEDTYMQERVSDVVDVGQRVLRKLLGTPPNFLNLSQPAILVATDLTPSDTAQLDPTKVLGICLTMGSGTSHSAIIARTLGIPTVVGVPEDVLYLENCTLVALDGETGRVWVEPEEDIKSWLQAKRDGWQTAQQEALTRAYQPATTRDGIRVKVLANVGGIDDTQVALQFGAEGVGLFRTEFLYLSRTTAPSEEEQFLVYQAIAQLLETRPLIIRTLDIGGDKPVPSLGVQPENNPFLGWRGIRFCLDRPEIFKTQLRAILRASAGHNIKIMFPMIATVAEVQSAKALLAEVQAELNQAGIPFDEAMSVGIMVEVPSAVVIADKLAAEVDFFSIGTNDLTQYIMACDRTNPRVAALADAKHPAVLRMIQQTIQAAHNAGIWVGLCGELAADSQAVPILLGLGLDEVSMNPQTIPAFKEAIAQLTLAEAEAIAFEALQ